MNLQYEKIYEKHVFWIAIVAEGVFDVCLYQAKTDRKRKRESRVM